MHTHTVEEDVKKGYVNLFELDFNEISEGVFVANNLGTCIHVNGTGAKMLGYEVEEIIGMSIPDLIYEKDLERYRRHFKLMNLGEKIFEEYEMKRKDDKSIIAELSGRKLLDGNLLGIIRDVTSRKEIEDALKESERKLKEAHKLSQIGHWDWDFRKNILSWSDEVFTIFGVSKDTFTVSSENFEKAIHPDDLQFFLVEREKALNAGNDVNIEHRIVCPEGGIKYVDERARIIRDNEGNALWLLGTVQDITDRKRKDSLIIEQKENLDRLLNTVPSAVYTVDNNKIITGWNKRAEVLTGYHEQEVLGKECSLFAGESCICNCGLLAEDVKKPVINKICTIRTKNGDMRHISKNVEAVYNRNGEIVGGIECFEDITEKLLAENILKESHGNFNNFFNAIDDMLIVATAEGRILYVNRAFSDKLGYKIEELSGMHVLDVHPREFRPEAEHIFEAMFKGERDFCPLPLLKKDGDYFPVETRVWFGKWDGNDCIYGISKDLSKQQAALEKFHKLFDNNPALMAVTNIPERRFVEVNEAFINKIGYSREEIIGKTSQELNLFVQSEKQIEVAERLQKFGRINEIELMIRKKNGEILEGAFSGEIIQNQTEKLFLTVMVDITEVKDAKETLRMERQRLENIITGTNVGTWEWHVQTGETIFNERWANIIGYSLEELSPVDIDTWKRFAHPEDLAESERLLNRHFNKELDTTNTSVE